MHHLVSAWSSVNRNQVGNGQSNTNGVCFPCVCVCFAINMGKAGRTVEAYNEHRSGKYIKYLSANQSTTTSHQILSCRWEKKIFITSDSSVGKCMGGVGRSLWERDGGRYSEGRGKRGGKTGSERDQREMYSVMREQIASSLRKFKKISIFKCSKTQG